MYSRFQAENVAKLALGAAEAFLVWVNVLVGNCHVLVCPTM